MRPAISRCRCDPDIRARHCAGPKSDAGAPLERTDLASVCGVRRTIIVSLAPNHRDLISPQHNKQTLVSGIADFVFYRKKAPKRAAGGLGGLLESFAPERRQPEWRRPWSDI
jgi:hypothetical protein